MDDHVRQVTAVFDAVAADYDQHVPFFTAFAQQLDIRPGERVLDIDCGRGAVSAAARQHGATAVALDLSLLPCCAYALSPRLHRRPRLGVRDASFDVAIGAFSIHLLPDPVDGLREAARIVVPGGRVTLVYGGRFSSPKWDFFFDVLRRYSQRATRPPTLPPVTPIPNPTAAFTTAGLANINVTEATIELPVANPHAFLRSEQAHGFRSFFDIHHDDVRRELEQELLAHLEDLHRAGGIVLRRTCLVVTGTRSRA
jgi:SAM-dependent methyltransferase